MEIKEVVYELRELNRELQVLQMNVTQVDIRVNNLRTKLLHSIDEKEIKK